MNTDRYLIIKRNGKWETSICSNNTPYLAERGREWKRLAMIEDYRIDLMPFNELAPELPQSKGAFGLTRGD